MLVEDDNQYRPHRHTNKRNGAALHEGSATHRATHHKEDETDCQLQNQSETGDTGGLLVGVLVSSHRSEILRGNGGIPGARVGASGYCIPVTTALFWSDQINR
jgi:hypothetical protein